MKTFAIYFVALFAVSFAKSVINGVESDSSSRKYGFRDNETKFNDGIEQNEDKIVGGDEITIEQQPYTLSLRVEYDHACGGAILTAVRGITTTFCLKGGSQLKDYSIMAGSTTRRGDLKAQKRPLTKFVMHELADKIPFQYSIAILFWEQPLTFGANVRSIRLPTANATVPSGQSVITSGWGETAAQNGSDSNILKAVTTTVVSNEECSVAYPGEIVPHMLCTKGEAGRGACRNDWGNPLVHDNILVGMVLRGRICGYQGYPTIHTRVPFFVDWIKLVLIGQ